MKKSEIVIPEIDQPKTSMIGFKVNAEDKELIYDWCKENNYRISAAIRVIVLDHIRKDIEAKKNEK